MVSRIGGHDAVLNLIINGLPSILQIRGLKDMIFFGVLNLIINGLPSILDIYDQENKTIYVLNLIINGLPSIHFQ